MSEESVAVHAAADALVAYARDVFWRDDSAFQRSSRHSYEAAAAWLHEHAEGIEPDANPDYLVHAFAPTDGALSLCGEPDAISTTTDASAVTCGWCRVKATRSGPDAGVTQKGGDRG